MTSPCSYFVEVLEPARLSPVDIDAWETLQAASPEFANPLMSPYFFLAVGAIREDARVAVYRREGEAVGFLAFHKRPGGLARPIGAPFCDYHGLVSRRDIGLSGAQALTLAGIGTLSATGLVDPFGLFATARLDGVEAFDLRLTGSAEDYLEALRAGNPKRFKNYRRLESKLEREVGPLRFETAETDPAAFETLIAWKREQFHRTGLQDVLAPEWTRGLMRALFETREGPMTGKLAALYAGDQLVAAHFGVRQGRVFHPWLAGAAPDLGDYSPGQLFLIAAIRSMPDDGLESYDLASGHEHYKRPFGPVVRTVGAGVISAKAGGPSLARLGPSPARKILRRLDHIAAIHPTFGGRAIGLAEAAFNAGKRLRGNHPSMDGAS